MSAEAAANTATATTYVGAGISVGTAIPHYVFGFTLDEWGVLGILFGMVMAIVGWLTTIYFKRQQSKLLRSVLKLGLMHGSFDENLLQVTENE